MLELLDGCLKRSADSLVRACEFVNRRKDTARANSDQQSKMRGQGCPRSVSLKEHILNKMLSWPLCATFVCCLSTAQTVEDNPLKMPAPGFSQLTIVSPKFLELTLVTTKKPYPAPVEQ